MYYVSPYRILHDEHYVKVEYIGTVGCFTSPTLYEYVLNISEGKEKCTYYLKPTINIGDVNTSRKTEIP